MTAVANQVVPPPPAVHQTTRVLQHMSAIAAKRAVTTHDLDTPSTETGEEPEPDYMEDSQGVPDVQPVLEYIERGPTSTLHIADPFFAFYLRWGTDTHLNGWVPPRSTTQEADQMMLNDLGETDMLGE